MTRWYRWTFGLMVISLYFFGFTWLAAEAERQSTPLDQILQRTPTPTRRATATPTPTPTPLLPFEGRLHLIPAVESEHPYANRSDEVWLVSNPDADAGATRLRFARLDLEEGVDWLLMLDAYDNEMQRLTGRQPDNLWSEPVPGTLVKLRLVTDGSVRRWGFAVDALASVPYTTLAYSPHPYPHNSSLEWRFNNLDPNAVGTRLRFSRVELEENVDWLVIMDLAETPYQWITSSHPKGLWTVGVPGNGVIVRLISDGSVSRWGFNLDALETAKPGKAEPRPEPEKALAESKHPYETDVNKTWTLVNPNPSAAFTKVHFSRLDMEDGLRLYDGNGNLVQDLSGKRNVEDFWSDDIPGRVVKVQLVTDRYDGREWGFHIDDIAPKAEERPVPAFVSGVRVRVGQPGELWVNSAYFAPRVGAGRLPDLPAPTRREPDRRRDPLPPTGDRGPYR